MNYKDGKWAKKIIELQRDDGSWGNEFHSLSNPSSKQMATEQALRRLKILGFTIDDKPIKKAVKYITDCLIGKSKPPDREEKRHSTKIYMPLMLSTWIRVFTNENEFANNVAEKWANIINAAFKNGDYDNDIYVNMYEKIMEIKLNPEAGRLVDFVHFYPVSLLTNILDKNIEPKYFEYILKHECGMFYIYDKKIKDVPRIFQVKTTSNYLRAIELLAKYNNPECKKQLKFAKIWLNENMTKNNEWDLGKEAKDGINFPLSDSWRTEKDRIKDCTYRIKKLLDKINID